MTSPRRVRRAIAAARVTAGLVVASTLLSTGAGSAQAQSTPAPALGGFTGSAAASGLHALYNPVGLLPTGPPIDLGAPDALATIASGPSTFARAGVADPGDLLANPDALLAAASADYPQGAIPAFPFRISASSGVGEPVVESDPAPGLHARVQAEGGASAAEATLAGSELPAVVTVGSSASYADTVTDGATVTVHARSEFAGVDILGVVQIESIVTELTATSAGNGVTFTGATIVTGATVAGTPATIDEEGVRAAGIDLSSLLGPLGVDITLPGPVALEGDNTGQLASTGLRIDIEASRETVPVLGDVLDGLPPFEPLIPGAPGIEDLVAVARARNLVSVELGRGVVSLSARTPTPRPASAPTATPAAPSSGATSPVASAPAQRPATAVPAARPSTATPAATPVAAAPVAATATPPLSIGAGVGALAVLLLLVQPFIGDRLSRVAAAQLATDQESCPWERR